MIKQKKKYQRRTTVRLQLISGRCAKAVLTVYCRDESTAPISKGLSTYLCPSTDLIDCMGRWRNALWVRPSAQLGGLRQKVVC